MTDHFTDYYKAERMKNPANAKLIEWAKQQDGVTYHEDTDTYEIEIPHMADYLPYFGRIKFSANYAIHWGFSPIGFWQDFAEACGKKGMKIKAGEIRNILGLGE